ncbi:MAG: domain S-box [Verrucomicrobiales bacterium]|nr:domain S-box [Verrucomicrobiales bacterium]
MFHLLFERTADAVWLFDPGTGLVVDCNHAAMALMRCSGKELLIGKRWEDLAPAEQPDGLSSKEAFARRIAETLAKTNARFDWTARGLDGATLPLEVTATSIERDGKPMFVMISRDISERKQSEREILELNETLEQRVGERTVELVLANEQLKGEIAERRRQEKIQRATYQISEAVHMADDLPSFYGRVHAIVGTLMSARNFYIALLDGATEIVSFPYFVDEQSEEGPEPRPLGTGLTGVVLRTGKPLLVDRTMSARARREGNALRLEGVDVPYVEAGREAAVWLGAPFLFHGRAFGMIALQDYVNETAYGQSEKQILTFVAEQTALAITRKRAEQALRDSEEQHRALFEATSQGVMLHDDKAFFSVNPAVVRMLGYKHPSELLGRHPAELASPFQPDGQESRKAAGAHIERCLREGSARFEWLTVRADGSQVMMDVLLTAIDLGERRIIQAVVDDITERKRAELALRESEARLRESEARFSTAFRASPALITISRLTDPRFVEVNEAFEKWLGLERSQILGRSSQDLGIWTRPEDRGQFLDELRLKGSVRDVEQQMRTHHGTIHTLLLSGDIIEINREPHVLVFALDITQRKQAEAELLKTLAREKELGQLRSKFVSMVSHEFRTPLGIIQSSAEILQDYLEQLEPSERKEHLQSIQKNTRRMAGLMEEVLLIGSLDAGKMEFRPAALDLAGFVRRLVEEIAKANKRASSIHLCLGVLPGELPLDERLLRHILTNLLTNALKYSEVERAVQFEVKQEGLELVFVVRDQGIGIPEADREWLFNAFHRGGNVGMRPGTGLGLVIVKRCVDLHGGSITIDSELGKGTSVTVRLSMIKTIG